jgi:hypothetical protein
MCADTVGLIVVREVAMFRHSSFTLTSAGTLSVAV